MSLRTGITKASRSPNSPKFDSSCIQPHLCHVDNDSPDVLLLYDSCHPTNGQGSIESSKAVVELLAACGFETRAPEVGKDSFTHSLIQELAEAASRSAGISVPELHRRQICRLQSWKSDVLLTRDDAGKRKVCLNGHGVPLFEPPVRRTPIHCQLSLNDRPRAIVLSPPPAQTKIQEDFIDLSKHNSGAAGVGNATAQSGSPPHLHALLRVSLVEDEFSETEFRDWLCGAPEATKGIKILGVLPSCSTMLLIQLPVEIWDLLPSSPAVSFIGFVQDDDTKATVASTLAGPTETSTPDGSGLATPRPSESTVPPFEDVGVSNRRKGKERAVSFQLSQSDSEKSLVEVLNLVDKVLPTAFHRLREMETAIGFDRVSFIVWEVLQDRPEMTIYDDVLSHPQVRHDYLFFLVHRRMRCTKTRQYASLPAL